MYMYAVDEIHTSLHPRYECLCSVTVRESSCILHILQGYWTAGEYKSDWFLLPLWNFLTYIYYQTCAFHIYILAFQCQETCPSACSLHLQKILSSWQPLLNCLCGPYQHVLHPCIFLHLGDVDSDFAELESPSYQTVFTQEPSSLACWYSIFLLFTHVIQYRSNVRVNKLDNVIWSVRWNTAYSKELPSSSVKFWKAMTRDKECHPYCKVHNSSFRTFDKSWSLEVHSS